MVYGLAVRSVFLGRTEYRREKSPLALVILSSFNERGSDRTLLLTAELYDFLKNPTKKWSFEKANMSFFNGGFVIVIAQMLPMDSDPAVWHQYFRWDL